MQGGEWLEDDGGGTTLRCAARHSETGIRRTFQCRLFDLLHVAQRFCLGRRCSRRGELGVNDCGYFRGDAVLAEVGAK